MPYLYVIGLAVATQFVLLFITFPLSELWSGKPLLFSDHGYHWYLIVLAKNLAREGMIIGYDPFFAAGYANGANFNGSAKLPTALAFLLQRWLSTEVVYKLYVFVSALIAPICVALAARWMKLSWRPAAIAVAVGIILWWASVFHWYFSHGMVSFVTAAYLALPYFACLSRWLQGEVSRSSLFALGIAGGVGMFWHPLFPLPVIFATIAYFLVCRRQLDLRRVVWLVTVVPALSLLFNLFWFVTQYRTVTEVLSPTGGKGPYQTIVDINLVWQELLGIWSGHSHGSKLYPFLAFAAGWACFLSRSDRDRQLSRILSLAGLFLIMFAAVGAALPGSGTLEPNRFAPVGYLMFCIPAAIGFGAMLAAAKSRTSLYRRAITVGSLCLVLAGFAYGLNEVRREVSFQPVGHYGKLPPLVNGVGDYSRWVLNWLNTETDASGRVLFELSLGRLYDGSRMAGYYAYTSQRQLVGGPYPFHQFASFWDGTLFRRHIEDISHLELAQYFDLYNIRWVIAHSATSKHYLQGVPGVIPTGEFNELRTYRIDRVGNYLASGEGRIAAVGHNTVSVKDASGSEIVLKYHYVKGLHAEPPAAIEPVYLLDDPTPFVKVVNPPKDFALRMQ